MTFNSLLSLLLEVASSDGAKIEAGGAVQVEAELVNKLNPANNTGVGLRMHPLYMQQKLGCSCDPYNCTVGVRTGQAHHSNRT